MKVWVRLLAISLLACGYLTSVSLASAQEYPVRPIKLVVPFGAGGGGDISARMLTSVLEKSLGQSIIIENRAGAGGIAATQSVLASAPDGYTLLLMGNINAIGQSMFKSIPYNIVKDFAPISILVTTDVVVFSGKSSPFNSMPELIDHARKKPNSVTIGVGLSGTTQHLTAELFKAETGIDAVVVPFRSSAELVTAVRRGDVDVGFDLLAPVLSTLVAGDLKPLAVTASKRSPFLPETPTFTESGISVNVVSWSLIAAAVNTPESVITRLNDAISKALANSDLRKKFQSLSFEVAGGTPAEARQFLVGEIAKWKHALETAKINPS